VGTLKRFHDTRFDEENDDIDPLPDAQPLREQFAGLPLRLALSDWATASITGSCSFTTIVRECAMIADQCRMPSSPDTVGDLLRARLYARDPS